jgi:hypothetical protein
VGAVLHKLILQLVGCAFHQFAGREHQVGGLGPWTRSSKPNPSIRGEKRLIKAGGWMYAFGLVDRGDRHRLTPA